MTAVLAGAGVLLLLTVTTALLRRRLVVVSVSGASMAPTLGSGDRVLVRRTPGEAVRAGQIVVVEEPRPCRRGESTRPRRTDWLVKRVVAVPGDLTPAFLPAWERGPDSRVPPRRLVLLGDNAEFSRDSRHFGSVSTDRVLGVALRRVGGGTLRPAPVDGAEDATRRRAGPGSG
ncbi:S26 family signal peptidase [Plantactinospora sp. S1510]|uniref:S26 family signal peptidase n=1 Tax=Plantactinospora alkalitolerans TaxID=2789879 RepID=A0ABS0H428_9ACTN|nr:S26 family signal peptidase [Plantactinospora alkalitolerans]MBF9133218.1 S26 family signal peptidase [Plantactinospora alkalitolerans]